MIDINNKIDEMTFNEKMEEMLLHLKKIQIEESSELDIVISIITFAEKAECKVEQIMITDYVHNFINFDSVNKSYSNAFAMLNEKLSRKKFMNHTGKIAQPYIIIVTDGESTSEDNYESELDALLENGWFKASNRFAVLVGEDAINSTKARNTVNKFVSNPFEGIIGGNELVDIVSDFRPIHLGPHRQTHNATEESGHEEFDNCTDFGGFVGFDGVFGKDSFI